MATHPIWRTRPVFVTSTFRDMHAERDHLRNVVFPALDERLRARFHYLEPIDLRLGVTTDEAADPAQRELLILKVCLDEIARSRPFLIGLLGDRYGWVPPRERMDAAAREAGFEHDLTGRSVTALEVEFGVMGSRDQQSRSRFYLREPLPYDRMDPATAAEYSEACARDPEAEGRRRRLADLKALLRRELPDRVRTYGAAWDPEAKRVKDLDAWGRLVIEDLWRDLEAEIENVEPPATWQEQEARILDAFVATSCPEFVGRKTILADLTALATGAPSAEGIRGLCVVGPAGSGKSSLFAELHRRLRPQPEIVVLAHAAGIGPRASDIDSILRRWCFELASELGIADPSETVRGRDDLRDAFSTLLFRAAGTRRVVCLVDALNQLERSPDGIRSTWLPERWPENARLVATAVPGSESEGLLQNRKWMEARTLDPLTGSEAVAIAQAVARRRHADVRPELLRRLTSTAASGNPLWLELALEEVLLLDEDDFKRAERAYEGNSEARLHALRMDVAEELPAPVEDLYRYLLRQTEKAHGESAAREFAILIATGRTGWRETDLRELLPARTGEPWDELRFASLRRGFRAHLAQRGARGQWDFTHTQMREAVRRRHLGEDATNLRAHADIARHLERLPDEDPLRQTELMLHLLRSDDLTRAAAHYAADLDPANLRGATDGLASEILVRAADGATAAGTYAARLLAVEGIRDPERGVLCNRYVFDLADALENSATLDLRLAIQRGAKEVLERLAASDPGNAGWQRDLSVSQERIGNVLLAQGDAAGALESYRASFVIRERLARQDPTSADRQRDLSVSQTKVGDVRLAQGDAAGALESYRASLVILERLARQDPTSADRQRDLVVSHFKLSTVSQQRGDQEEVLNHLRSCATILRGMRDRGMHLDPPMAQLLAQLEQAGFGSDDA